MTGLFVVAAGLALASAAGPAEGPTTVYRYAGPIDKYVPPFALTASPRNLHEACRHLPEDFCRDVVPFVVPAGEAEWAAGLATRPRVADPASAAAYRTAVVRGDGVTLADWTVRDAAVLLRALRERLGPGDPALRRLLDARLAMLGEAPAI